MNFKLNRLNIRVKKKQKLFNLQLYFKSNKRSHNFLRLRMLSTVLKTRDCNNLKLYK